MEGILYLSDSEQKKTFCSNRPKCLWRHLGRPRRYFSNALSQK